MEKRFTVQTSTSERLFVKVYRDFLNSGLLSGTEQILFIHLKQYINFANDNGTIHGEVYPTLSTLAKNVKMTEKTVRTVLQELQKKGILEIKQQGLNKPNIYKISDNAEMWKSGNVKELKTVIDKTEEQQMIEALTAKGYYVTKQKEPELTATSKATVNSSTYNFSPSETNNTVQIEKSQDLERYTLEQIQQLFDYHLMIQDNNYPLQDIDSCETNETG